MGPHPGQQQTVCWMTASIHLLCRTVLQYCSFAHGLLPCSLYAPSHPTLQGNLSRHASILHSCLSSHTIQQYRCLLLFQMALFPVFSAQPCPRGSLSGSAIASCFLQCPGTSHRQTSLHCLSQQGRSKLCRSNP